ncbi:1-acyl-sn-glycerol-3-phosphate acyltransferase [Allobranchiibius sp. CTAmp26]|uniref:lysophospholipid acyltransferase family protein n=1 Tax=Allobranchiibius sp. CTAmp26 TaxID=2815214 RepID=UPI001AA18F6E|nr:lysophospholipid acyltransferase family protein [Allobranchiibius sp. CTAmp26]MBO1756709.1 1-acyl-sn-glycerol-3-phosphate acyltransferase [Allobranchiibius sp. CTAmp26]
MLYRAAKGTVSPVVRALWRPQVDGADNVPRHGGVLLASNHLSFIDSVVIPLVAPRQVRFLAKSDYFTGTGAKGAASRLWFETMGMIPVERDDSQAAAKSLELALRVLAAGDAFGIYPEGTRSRDGRLYRGHTGVAHLALTAGVPVVPVGLIGTDKVQPVGDSRVHREQFTVRFGAPINPVGRWTGVPAGRARRELTDQVMDAIAQLSGQPRAAAYNERPSATG